MFGFLVHGCADPVAPSHGWVTREAGNATFGCNNSTTRWRMMCDGTTWKGSDKNCSVTLSSSMCLVFIVWI